MANTRTRSPRTCPALEGMEPLEVAAYLEHLPGLVFFDSAGHLPGSARQPVSLIAAAPKRVIEGRIQEAGDRARLREAMAELPAIAGDHGFPLGGLAGWVSYEGDFVFGQYPEMLIYDHSHSQWWELGELSSQLRKASLPSARISSFRPLQGQEHFIRSVERIQEC